MDTSLGIQLGILLLALATASAATIKAVGTKVDAKFDKVTDQIDRLRDVGTERHIANTERLARLEGQISALPQKTDFRKGN